MVAVVACPARRVEQSEKKTIASMAVEAHAENRCLLEYIWLRLPLARKYFTKKLGGQAAENKGLTGLNRLRSRSTRAHAPMGVLLKTKTPQRFCAAGPLIQRLDLIYAD